MTGLAKVGVVRVTFDLKVVSAPHTAGTVQPQKAPRHFRTESL